MEINIDKNSGFCFGVVYAIEHAEKELEKNNTLYCLGDIVHNNVEVKRLEDKGLITIDHQKFKKLKDCKVLIRAHGEPPETYEIANKNNIELIDATCPVVLKLQQKIKKGFTDISEKNGQLVIFGKKGHAEVIGLLGQTGGRGIVISGKEDLDKLDFTKPINIFSQTTKSLIEYAEIRQEIEKRISKSLSFISNNSICGAVSHRDKQLKKFSTENDIVIFVSGKKSSNGKMLYEVCKKENDNTYFISDSDELDKKWFTGAKKTGICGATSTPAWLMEKVKNKIIDIT